MTLTIVWTEERTTLLPTFKSYLIAPSKQVIFAQVSLTL